MKNYILYIVLSLLGIVSCKPTQIALLSPNTEEDKVKVAVFMEQAVYNGLVNDRFPVAKAQYILDNRTTFFVGKCPVCMPTERGIERYVEGNPAYKKSNVAEYVWTGLASSDKETQQKAFSQLIMTYTKAHKTQLNLSEMEKAKLEQNLQNARKQGMGGKTEAFGKFCPSCDGACEMEQ